MGELNNKVTDLEIKQATPATVATSLLANLQELAKIMDSGLEMHQHVNVGLPRLNYASIIMYTITSTGRCPTLSNPSNGRVDQRSNRPGATALYTCNIGYELVGLSSRTCQNNGQWSGEAPTCESNYKAV